MVDIKLSNNEDTIYQDIDNLTTTANISLMEAIIEVSARNNIEIEYVASLINNKPELKAKLQVEAETLNFLKKTQRILI